MQSSDKQEYRHNAEYFPVPVDALKSNNLEMDIYLIYANNRVVLYRARGTSYSAADSASILKKGISHFYVPITQHRQFQSALKAQIVNSYDDPTIGNTERARIVRGACSKMIEDFMHDPTRPGLTDSIDEMATQFNSWMSEDQSKFSYLLEMSDHDFYTTTHMINVGIACGMLGAELLGTDDPLVPKLMYGGLIHDIGKAGVSVEVLNKEGKLTDDEWAQIRRHPQNGADILKKQPNQEAITVDMTLNHHERLDGKGYPNGLTESELTLPSKICAVVDIYDAMTSARPYRGPIPPRTVLDIMRKDVGTAIDQTIFEAWERVVNRLLDQDPTRASPEVEGDSLRPLPTLQGMIPNAITQDEPDEPEVVIPAHSNKVSVRRSTGEVIDAEILEMDIDLLTLITSFRFKPSESLIVCRPVGPDMSVVYKSKQFDRNGAVICVFDIIARIAKAA